MLVTGQLPFVIGADAGGGGLQRGPVLGRDPVGGGGDRGIGDAHRLRCQVETVESDRQVAHGGVATGAHVGDNRGDGIVDIGRILALHGQQRGEAGIEIGVGGGQELRHP